MPSLAMRSALVTGGNGFIGRHLVNALRRRGVDVTTLGRKRPPESTDATHVDIDGSWDSGALDRALERRAPDCIFHLAGRARGTPDELAHANVVLTNSLVRALTRTDVQAKLVVAGSAAEYGSAIRDGEPVCETAVGAPSSAYGAAKLAQTCVALDHGETTGRAVLVARIFNPLGAPMPAHLAIGDFATQIASLPQSGGTLRVGNIDVRRDMIDVEHVATLLCDLAENPFACGVVNLCSGEAPRLRDLVAMLIEGFGRKVTIEVDEARLRGKELRTIVGSVERLAKLGRPPPPTDFPAVIARVCRAAEQAAAPPS